MQYPYLISQIKPVRVTMDLDGNTHAIYDLPAPKRWEFTEWIGDVEEENCVPYHYIKEVTQVNVCYYRDEDGLLGASVSPHCPDEEDMGCIARFIGVVSFLGVLENLGFVPALPPN